MFSFNEPRDNPSKDVTVVSLVVFLGHVGFGDIRIWHVRDNKSDIINLLRRNHERVVNSVFVGVGVEHEDFISESLRSHVSLANSLDSLIGL